MPNAAIKSVSGSSPNLDTIEVAESVGLRYVTDDKPGITRKRSGRGFSYYSKSGDLIRDKKILNRIKNLAIPPAYHDVWICPFANGHIQATGFDEQGRKQYRYHEKWREVRDASKFTRMIEFAQALPRIRERTAQDLRKPGLSKEKVLAAAVQILEKTAIRVGNEEYAQHNNSFGLTTLRNRHAKIEGAEVRFHFRGKSKKWHNLELHDRKLAKIVRALQELPGQEIFQYREQDGTIHSIDSGDVNTYIKEISGHDFTAKDFRTWAGTVLCSLALGELDAFESESQAKKNVVAAVKEVAHQLGNTPSVCRQSYIHPAILESYLDGSLLDSLRQTTEKTLKKQSNGNSAEEIAVVEVLQRHLNQSKKSK